MAGKRRYTISDEERQRRSERARAMRADGRLLSKPVKAMSRDELLDRVWRLVDRLQDAGRGSEVERLYRQAQARSATGTQ